MTSLLLENNKNKKVLSNCFYRPNWEKYTPMSYHHDESATCDLLWICFDWNGQLRNYFNNDNMIFIDFSELSGDLAAFFSCIIDAKPSCCRFITCLPQVETTDIIHFVQNWIWNNLINFIKHYHSVIKSIPIEICSITQNLFEVSSLNNIYVPLQALLVSTIYALSAEFPNTTFKMLDIHSISEVMNNNFLSQFNLVPTNSYLTWRNQQHWILRYQQVFIPNFISGKLALSNGDVYVLIGFGGIAIELAKYFVENVSCHIIFLTRKVVISVEKESDLEQIRQKASTVELMQVDVTDEKSLEETFANIQKRFTFITGVINTTGIFSAKTLRELTFSDWKDVLKPKLQGAISLLNVIKSIDLKFCYFFSSSTTLKYTIGTFSYYSANLFLDYYLRQFSSDARIRNIKWGMWQDVGMSNLERMENPTEEFHHFRQYFSFLPEEARMLFDKALACDCAELLITAEPLEGTDLKTKNLSVNDQVLEKMKAIWLSVLKVDSLNYNDNFFELGGHSLMAAQLINKINKTFSSKLNLQQLFHSPTLLGLAANLE